MVIAVVAASADHQRMKVNIWLTPRFGNRLPAQPLCQLTALITRNCFSSGKIYDVKIQVSDRYVTHIDSPT